MATETKLFDVPNLDGLSVSDYGRMETVFTELGRYCFAKKAGMIAREARNADNAVQYEKRCESIYSALPDWAKW